MNTEEIAMHTAFEKEYTDAGLSSHLVKHYNGSYLVRATAEARSSFQKGWNAHGKHIIAAIDKQVKAFTPGTIPTIHDVAKNVENKILTGYTFEPTDSYVAIAESSPGRGIIGYKFNSELTELVKSSVGVSMKEYQTSSTPEWNYLGIDADPPNGKIHVLTVGGVSIIGNSKTFGMIAWSPLLKRDKDKEEIQRNQAKEDEQRRKGIKSNHFTTYELGR